jgi:hypothetical protein
MGNADMKHYSIMVREGQSQEDTELCQCDTNPEDIVAAAKKIKLSAKVRIRRYARVYVRDNQPEQ